jgi:predicted CxxxxCH...CXXCH cytochrome family protein
MSSNGHHRLVGPQWIRKYPCYYCHNASVDADGKLTDKTKHVNGVKNIAIHPSWSLSNRSTAKYDPEKKICTNIYCHSDGTTDPEKVRPFAWTEKKTKCNTCHGHPIDECINCHNGTTDQNGKYWPVKTGWPAGNEWMGAMPMFPNMGPGHPRANSHPRHAETNFTCDICHARTVLGDCLSCHDKGIPQFGDMGKSAHLDGNYHVNTKKDVYFKDMPSAVYDKDAKTCSGTICHPPGATPVWGGSVNDAQTCLSCHGVTDPSPDVDDFGSFNGIQAKINLTQWQTTGHGRMSSASNTGSYPKSGNRAANFPGNPCWYCHDNSVLHKDKANIFRLRMHRQYERRFEKECIYCHNTWSNDECYGCHVNQTESLSPQATTLGIVYRFKNSSTLTKYTDHPYTTNCTNSANCHDSETGKFTSGPYTGKQKGHNSNAGVWTTEMKNDVKNQYLQMGVCLQCHDDDSNNQCTSCHIAPANNPLKYSLGYDPGTGFIKPKKARASGGHFGYKHYRDFTKSGGWLKHYTSVRSPIFGTYSVANGTWKGGKFCWDCHDPHGDGNIYMIHDKVATETDGWFGVPKPDKRKTVVFRGIAGTDYARKSDQGNQLDGICNVCHTEKSHYTINAGDGHNSTRRCTSCHEHRFANSHASAQSCDSCHKNTKPIPKHTAFGLPRDCTKCHSGTVGRRMDVIGQMKSNSHHVQGIEVNNKHCYACHWEATPEGLIDIRYHAGYDYKNYTSVKDAQVDLVIWKANGVRPTFYSLTSVTTFLAKNISVDGDLQRNEIGKITNHCISCHSDQNNDTVPFGDFKTPRQYAWDLQSVASRYQQLAITTWGKYVSTPNAAQKNIAKALSAHGNAVANGGGWDAATGLDGAITNTRAGTGNKNVQCFDCHNSHGSKVVGTTSSYITFNGTNNGANLKETKKEIGGYAAEYKASANTSGVNPYGAGAGQCFDCHNTATTGGSVLQGKTPWGYNSTFGASAPILGYKDTPRFMNPTQPSEVKASTARFSERAAMQTIAGGHLKASMPGSSLANLARYAGSASSGSTATALVDGSASDWTTDKWKNLYLLMDSGSNSGQLRRITGNTTTTLTIDAFNANIVAGDSYKIVPYSSTVNGLCSNCHDPHGVSQTISDQAYAVPLLKGTWMTSPYKEDSPPKLPEGNHISNGPNGKPRSWGRWIENYWPSNVPSPQEASTKHTIDMNTFGGATRIRENDQTFAGLCLNCHGKSTLTDGVIRNFSSAGFRTSDRVHESVKGWGANSEHSFSCSKCHQAHNSGLPRLLKTDCLNYKRRGGFPSGGEPWSTDKQAKLSKGTAWFANNASYGNHHNGYPIGSMYGGRGGTKEATTACHVSRYKPVYEYDNPPSKWPDENRWNNVTTW